MYDDIATGHFLFDRAKLKEAWTRAKPIFEEHGASFFSDSLFEGQYYPGGEPLDKEGRTQAEAEAQGDPRWWPSKDQTNKPAPHCWVLVGDNGVYLMPSHAKTSPSEAQTVVHALGYDPHLDEDEYYERKRRNFGGSDAAYSLPVDWADCIMNWPDEVRYIYFKFEADGGITFKGLTRKPAHYLQSL